MFIADDLDGVDIPQNGIRKSRSHSFSSSLKNLFKKKKKHKHQSGGTELYPPSSRESSVSRASGRGYDPAFAQPSPDMSSRDASVRHSPDPGRGERGPSDYPQYSSSVPMHAPIYDRWYIYSLCSQVQQLQQYLACTDTILSGQYPLVVMLVYMWRHQNCQDLGCFVQSETRLCPKCTENDDVTEQTVNAAIVKHAFYRHHFQNRYCDAIFRFLLRDYSLFCSQNQSEITVSSQNRFYCT